MVSHDMKEMTGAAARKAIDKSKLDWKDINVDCMRKYVGVRVERETINKAGLERVVPFPKGTTALKSFVSPRSPEARRTNGDSQFYPARDYPTSTEITKMIGLLVENCIATCMDSHFYTIGGGIRRQAKGGSIGSDLTGESARCYMMIWDDRFTKKVKNLGIHLHLYKRYVDDILVLLDSIRVGWNYSQTTNKMICQAKAHRCTRKSRS